MRKGVQLAVVLLVVGGGPGRVIHAAPIAIDYVLGHQNDYVNKKVTVRGVVIKSQARQPVVTDDVPIRGDYTIQDKTGEIRVLTRRNPPPLDQKRTVRGTVSLLSAGDLVVYEQGWWPPNPLYIALAVLVALAIVLVFLMVRPRGNGHEQRCPQCRARNPVGAATCWKCGYPFVIDEREKGTKPCPQCGFENALDAKFCEKCGGETNGPPPPPPPPPCIYCHTSNGASDRLCSKCGEDLTGTMVAYADLTITDGPCAADGRPYALKPGVKHTIGRGERMLIVLKEDLRVSEEHAVVSWTEGQCFIQDAASTNGTMVNGQKITRQALAHGDEIQVGNTKL